jgi:NADH:ubiquinone oxidoreductase subunit 6 (subunit J)
MDMLLKFFSLDKGHSPIWVSIYFFICVIGLISALLILTSLNPISRLLLLILVYIKSAFLYILLDYYFLGLTYIIVYVGAISILFLFIIKKSETVETPKSLNQLALKSINTNS